MKWPYRDSVKFSILSGRDSKIIYKASRIGYRAVEQSNTNDLKSGVIQLFSLVADEIRVSQSKELPRTHFMGMVFTKQ